MTLELWLQNKWIHEHKTSAAEICALLGSAAEDLRSSESKDIDPGWKLAMAYTSSLRCARAALAASGYRPGREREHERLIDSLVHTLGMRQETIKHLHTIRKKRHAATYDSIEFVSDSDADAATRIAREVQRAVRDWLEANHPHLLS